jgi:hypothetical protein
MYHYGPHYIYYKKKPFQDASSASLNHSVPVSGSKLVYQNKQQLRGGKAKGKRQPQKVKATTSTIALL